MEKQTETGQKTLIGWRGWAAHYAPDFAVTIRRFPFAILLAGLATLVFLALTNEWVSGDEETWVRLAAGLVTGAVFATAGPLFSESRPHNRLSAIALTYGPPLAAIGLFQIKGGVWVTPYVLPVVAVLFLSVAPFLRNSRGEGRQTEQNRFWWLNHRAVTTGAIALTGYLIIAFGTFVIERSLSLLFGLHLNQLLYNYVLPVFGLFVTPVYWLSTLPELSQFDSGELDNPDFLSRAIGFLGQFMLAPLLLVYALILLAYAAQIAFTGSLPAGILGWMVLGFTITGAGAWLVLHPPFMRSRVLVRFFRRWWFWTTLVPLGLYALAVGVRIDAYGLTPERMGLIAGGLWAGLLTIAFLIPRLGDIRLVPGLAAFILLVFSFGPWNLENAPRLDQARRLDLALHVATPVTDSTAENLSWTKENADTARGSLDFLRSRQGSKELLADVLRRHGIAFDPETDDRTDFAQLLDLPEDTRSTRQSDHRGLIPTDPDAIVIDVSATPYVLAQLDLYPKSWRTIGPWTITLRDNHLNIAEEAGPKTTIDLADWVAAQSRGWLDQPVIDFEHEGMRFRLVVHATRFSRANTVEWNVIELRATLFSAAPPPASP